MAYGQGQSIMLETLIWNINLDKIWPVITFLSQKFTVDRYLLCECHLDHHDWFSFYVAQNVKKERVAKNANSYTFGRKIHISGYYLSYLDKSIILDVLHRTIIDFSQSSAIWARDGVVLSW